MASTQNNDASMTGELQASPDSSTQPLFATSAHQSIHYHLLQLEANAFHVLEHVDSAGATKNVNGEVAEKTQDEGANGQPAESMFPCYVVEGEL